MLGKVPPGPEAVASTLESQKALCRLVSGLIVGIQVGSVLERSGLEWPHCITLIWHSFDSLLRKNHTQKGDKKGKWYMAVLTR